MCVWVGNAGVGISAATCFACLHATRAAKADTDCRSAQFKRAVAWQPCSCQRQAEHHPTQRPLASGPETPPSLPHHVFCLSLQLINILGNGMGAAQQQQQRGGGGGGGGGPVRVVPARR